MVLPPVSNKRVVDFGAGIGRKSVYLYNLPEVTSGHQVGALPCFACCACCAGRKSVYLYNLPEVTSGHQVGACCGCCASPAKTGGTETPAVAPAVYCLPAMALHCRTKLPTIAPAVYCMPAVALHCPPAQLPGLTRNLAAHTAAPLLPTLPPLLQVFGVPSISARFGTAPEIWNYGMVAMARLAPKSEHPPAARAPAFCSSRSQRTPGKACMLSDASALLRSERAEKGGALLAATCQP